MNLLTNKSIKVLVQGITGREASAFTRDMIDYGTNVVAGVTPGKGGMVVHGVPVFDTVSQAVSHGQVDAAVISVPPMMVREAVLESIANGVKLIVIVTERIPRKDTVDFLIEAKRNNVMVIGPNSLGLICPRLNLKLGMAGGPVDDVKKAYMPGPVAIASRSGGMTTEIANLLTTNGIGQSLCVSIGGDPVVGSNFIDLLPIFEKDQETKALVIFCEPGGVIEEELSRKVIEENIKLPIIAFIAGKFVDDMPGVRFGHAATIVEGDSGSTKSKKAKFMEAGILVAESFSDIITLTNKTMSLSA